MRNLKRALALALASVMMMSMMTVGAGAVTFNDADEIANVSAATVLEALDIMIGDDEGNFNASAVVTRAEMCVLMCKMFYGSDYSATTGGTTTFTDISGHWGEAYIEAAYAAGWISGKDAETFDPNATVLTYEAALMMQRVLGYYSTNDDSTYTMPASAVSLINKLSMFDGITTPNATAGLTRDDVAVLVYNTMFDCVKVEYSYANKIYYACDIDSTSGTDKEPDVTNPNINYDFGAVGTLAADVHDVSIELDYDALGRPVDAVIVDDETLATSPIDYDAMYIAEAEYDDVYDEADCSVDVDYSAVEGSANAKVYVNGEEFVYGDAKDEAEAVLWALFEDGDGTGDASDELDEGYVIEVYNFENANGNDTTHYVAYCYMADQIDDIEYDDDEDVTVIEFENVKGDFYIDGDVTGIYEAGDYIMITCGVYDVDTSIGDYIIDTIVMADIIEGEVTAVNSDETYYYVDGTKYTFAQTYEDDYSTDYNHDVDDVIAFILDPNGYVIASEEVEGAATAYDYLYVLSVDSSIDSFNDTFDVKALFADGSTSVITVYELDGYEHGDEIDTDKYQNLEDIAVGNVYEYDVDDDGYELESVTDVKSAYGADIETGYTKITGKTDGVAISGFSDDTVFVSNEDGATWVGYENVADFEGANVTAVWNEDDDLVVVFVTEVEADSTDDGVYVIFDSADYYTTKIDGDTYYVYEDAYIDGEQVELVADSALKPTAYTFYELTTDGDGYATDITAVSTSGTAEVNKIYYETLYVASYGSTTITAGTDVDNTDEYRFTYDDDTIFVYVDEDGDVSEGSVKDLFAYDADDVADGDDYIVISILVDDAEDMDAIQVIVWECADAILNAYK